MRTDPICLFVFVQVYSCFFTLFGSGFLTFLSFLLSSAIAAIGFSTVSVSGVAMAFLSSFFFRVFALT